MSDGQLVFIQGSNAISLHLKNIFHDNELDENATAEDFSIVRQEGTRQVKRRLKHYSLDAITSVSTDAVPAQQYDGRYRATM